MQDTEQKACRVVSITSYLYMYVYVYVYVRMYVCMYVHLTGPYVGRLLHCESQSLHIYSMLWYVGEQASVDCICICVDMLLKYIL